MRWFGHSSGMTASSAHPSAELREFERWEQRPFTTETALSMGVKKRDLYGPRYRQVTHGIFVATAIPDTIVVRARAARLVLPKDAVFSHETAGRLLGGPVPDTPIVHAAVGRQCRRMAVNLQLHRYTYEPDAMWRHGLPVTTPAQTLIHLSVKVGLLPLVAFGDAMVSRELVTLDELRRSVDDWSGHGAARAAYAMRYVRRGVDSAPESHLRLLFVLAGLPEPQVNYVDVGEDGRIIRRVELAFRDTPKRGPGGESHLGFEYDGWQYHSSPEQRAHDMTRREALREQGWHIEVFDRDDLYRATETVLLRACLLLTQFGIAVPSRLNDAWRRHFAVPTWVKDPL